MEALNVVSIVLMLAGLACVGFAVLYKATERWEWGRRNIWRIGVAGAVAMAVGAIIQVFV